MTRKITAIKAQKRNRDRVNIYLDGEYAFGLARIVAAWLQVGQELSEEKISELVKQDELEAAYARALRLLNQRDYTEAQLRKRLLSRDVPEALVEDVLERLRHAGLVNDQRYARYWVENRIEHRPRSRRALLYELKTRGVSPQALEAALEGVDDEQNAYRAALKQALKYRDLPWHDFRQKMYSFLARRGFSYDTVAPVVLRAWEQMKLAKDQGNAEQIKGEVTR